MKVIATSVQNLVKDGETGTYYVRPKVQGQTRYRSLDTKTFTTAKLRLPDKLKEIRESIPTEQPSGGLDIKATYEDVARIYSREITDNPRLRLSSKSVRLRPITTLRRTWPDLFETEVRRVTPAAISS